MKTNPELSQTLDLVDKNIKTVVIFYIVEKSEKFEYVGQKYGTYF